MADHDHEIDSNSSLGKSAQESGLGYVPDCYMVPNSLRPSSTREMAYDLPIVDLAGLTRGSDQRSLVVDVIRDACRRFGFFHIINHGICQTILDDALSSAFDFFESPASEKMTYSSDDVYKPVRYGTSFKDGVDKIQFWRFFLKHYAHPLEEWLDFWPTNPPTYREKMGKYCEEVQKVAVELMEVVSESLGLGPHHLWSELRCGTQVVTVNCYPPCPDPTIALGLPPHTDYACLTILLQSSPGLGISVPGDPWRFVPNLHGTLQVHVGDHLEVISGGAYRSLVHRATLSVDQRTRVSIASLHGLGMDVKVRTAEKLLITEAEEDSDGGDRVRYKESSFRDFLDFLTANDVAAGKSYIETLKGFRD